MSFASKATAVEMNGGDFLQVIMKIIPNRRQVNEQAMGGHETNEMFYRDVVDKHQLRFNAQPSNRITGNSVISVSMVNGSLFRLFSQPMND